MQEGQRGLPVPGAAGHWDISEDKLTYTFTSERMQSGIMVPLSLQRTLKMPGCVPLTLNRNSMSPLIWQISFLHKGCRSYAYGEGKPEDVRLM